MAKSADMKRERFQPRLSDSSERIILSVDDWEAFCAALIEPPEPNEKLREAARRYSERASADEPPGVVEPLGPHHDPRPGCRPASR